MTQAASRTVFVLGGTGGLGQAICRTFVEDGHSVFFTRRSNVDAADGMVAALGAGRVACAYADATDRSSIDAALAACRDRFGAPATVVFASGAQIAQPFVSEIDETSWREVFEVELMGLTRLVSASLADLRSQDNASLVCVTSVATASYPPGDALSAVPKAGMEMLVRAIAREEGRYGVRANCVAPGLMDAGLGAEFMRTIHSPAIWETQRRRVALRRFGRAEDVAGVVAFLASERAAYVTGQTIFADGGFRL